MTNRLNGDQTNFLRVSQQVLLDVDGEIRVSTVYIPLHEPLLPPYETMIFGGEHDLYQVRYATEAEAVVGHQEACKLAFG